MSAVSTVAASAARTTTGNSGALDVDDNVLSLIVDVTAVSGTTPTLDVTVEWSNDGTNFAAADGTADLFAQITAASKKVKRFPVKGASMRVVWTIAGTTPSFTFSVTATTFSA